MVSKGKVSKVIVAYENRLTRFGFGTFSKLFLAFGTTIEAINHEEKVSQKELIEYLITIVSHFARKLYGMRSHKLRNSQSYICLLKTI